MKISSLVRRLVGIVLAGGVLLCGCASGGNPVAEPKSGTILSGYAPVGKSEITISLAPTASCVIMLKDDSERVLLSFFVRAGDTVTVDVPAEKMYVHVAAGKTWYGTEKLFGGSTIYLQEDEIRDFSQNSWEYAFDPVMCAGFSYEEDTGRRYLAEADTDRYTEVLEGTWESVHLNDGSFSMNVSALVFPGMIYNCTKLTVTMDVSMNAGTSCKDWQLWGRTGNQFVKLEKIYLPGGNGRSSETVEFDGPVSFDAIAITPTIPGGYSWSLGMTITDVWTE